MTYRPYAPPAPLLFGYDPYTDVPLQHLARLVDHVVEGSIAAKLRPAGPGQPPYDPRLCAKVLIFGYATGTRSSRQLERMCKESLPYLFLTRGDGPSYRTLCSFRVKCPDLIEAAWVGMFAVAEEVGIHRIGRIVVDSTKLRANAGPESVVKKTEYEAVLAELRQILKEAEATDASEDSEPPGSVFLEKPVETDQMRDILRRVRKERSQQKRTQVTDAQVTSEQVMTEQAAEAATTETQLANELVTSEQVMTEQAAEAATTETQLANGQVNSEQVMTEQAAEVATTETQLANGQVNSEQVMTEQAAEVATTETQLANGQVNSGQVTTEQAAEAENTPRAPLGPRMLVRVRAAINALEAAQEDGRAHVCLTDPDARMMGEGREKSVRECHSFEIAVDNSLLVAGQASQSPTDNSRLNHLVVAAEKNEPGGLVGVDADSGYYGAERIAALIDQGLDVCIPDSATACDLHRGQPIGTTRRKTTGSVEFTYDAEQDRYTCPEGNVLEPKQRRKMGNQELRVYRAQRDCTECPLRACCGSSPIGSKRRTLFVGTKHEQLRAHLDRFSEPDHVDRYHHRGHAVETVFGMLRGALGITRWLLRGDERVEAESKLLNAALQVRKLHVKWAQG